MNTIDIYIYIQESPTLECQAVLKTVAGETVVGSTPSLSAKKIMPG